MVCRLTLRGSLRLLEMALRGEYKGGTPPSNFYVALVTDDVKPTIDTQLFSELTEITAGNGYTAGGVAVPRSAVGFDSLTEDTTNKEATIQLKDVSWSASGGTIPASGSGASYAVLLDDNATLGDREVLGFWDLLAEKVIPDGGSYTLEDLPLVIGAL